MRISDAVADEREIEVPFGPHKLQVTYRPLTYTVAEMDAISRDERNPRRIIETIKRLVVKWDLEHDDLVNEDGKGVIVPLDHPEDDYENDPLRHIGTHIYSKIIQAVNADQQASGEAGRPSGAS